MLSIKNYLEGVRVEELQPRNGQKSFYKKAYVIKTAKGEYLKSYNTIILFKDNNGALTRYWSGWSNTTGKHIKAFCGCNKKEFLLIPFESTPQEKARLYSGALGW